MFKFLSKIITNWPVKALSTTLVLMLVFAVGATNIRLATSNDTLIETSSEVYQNNLSLESEFGGEAIIVLFEGKEATDLLTPEASTAIKSDKHSTFTVVRENDYDFSKQCCPPYCS
jgi:Predicted exporters of the RND superfamily